MNIGGEYGQGGAFYFPTISTKLEATSRRHGAVFESASVVAGRPVLTGSNLGWIAFVITLAVASAVIGLQHARIKSQGKELAKYRQRDGVKHFSAGRPKELAEYAAQRYPKAKRSEAIDPEGSS